MILFLDRTRDLDLLIYISDISPSTSYDFLIGQSPRSRLPIYISDVSPFSGQSLLTILLLIVSSYSNPSPYDNLGTFLVHLAIVLSLRKVPIGLVYKPTYALPCPLASSTHQLPSNLVSPLELSLVSSPNRLSDNCVIDPQESSSPS